MKWPQWFVDWVERDSKSWAPVPTIRLAYVKGQAFRWEKVGAASGTEYNMTAFANRLLKNVSAADADLDASYGPTHLQKQSICGFLITRPFCFHIWWQIRPQSFKVGAGGVVIAIPGSEICPYFRIGKGRWDALNNEYIKPTLYAGTHWD